jgi:glc operon protein GlcG
MINPRFHFIRKICQDIVLEAVDQGLDVSVHAVDLDGRCVVALRDDRGHFAAMSPARGKALASLMLRMPTNGAVPMMQAPDPVLVRAMSSVPDILVVPGGMPIYMNGELIGAVGVSGGHYRDDHNVCEKVVLAAIDANKKEHQGKGT